MTSEEPDANSGQGGPHDLGAGMAVPAPTSGAETESAATMRLPTVGSPASAQPTTQVMAQAPAPVPGVASAAPGVLPAPPATPALAGSARERCPVCTSAVAADQRYCVQCGQRLANARPTLMNDATRASGAPSAPPPRKPRFNWGPNGTLIAGIATLLLAMLVGVLIGHYSAEGSGSKHAAATPIIVPSTGATGTTATGATGETSSTPSASSNGAKSGSSASGASAHGSSSKPSAGGNKPANPSVQLGQKGHGQGYQHGEFTGHFFGNENEENAGEESEEEHKGGKKH